MSAGPAVAPPHFDFAHLLWYAGALIVMTAMGLFSTLAFSQMGGRALTVTRWSMPSPSRPPAIICGTSRTAQSGGLLIAIAVSMAPLAVYGIQDALDLWGQFGKPGTVQDSTYGSRAAGSSWRSPPSWPPRSRCASIRSLHRRDHRASRSGSCRWTSRPGSPEATHADWETAGRSRSGSASLRWSSPGSSTARARRRLCVLAAPVRHDRVLGRGQRDVGRRPARQGALLRDQCRAAVRLGRSSAGVSTRSSA